MGPTAVDYLVSGCRVYFCFENGDIGLGHKGRNKARHLNGNHS